MGELTLVNWRQIGNAVERAEQGLDLSDVAPSGGVQAATIRYHNGVFYITSTRIKRQWPGSDYHFVLTATDINGPWSKCHFIEDAYGIDSSLFFDSDKAYFLANRDSSNPRFENDAEIWISEINLDTFELVGEKHILWNGTGGIFPEGPRMYKRNGWYYLLIAEGGTLHFHTTSIARSKSVLGPYVSSQRNPILTHKHLAREYPVHNVGHADMVELKDGNWWGVALASRPRGGFYDSGNVKYSFGGYYRNLGRETFIFPVTWPADDQSPPTASISTEKLKLSIELSGDDQDYTFSAPELGFSHTLDGREISCDMTDSHTGVMIAFIGKRNHKSVVQFENFQIS